MTEPAKLGVVLLCHDHLDLAARMTKIWSDGGATVVIHVDAKAPKSAFTDLERQLQDVPRVLFSKRRNCQWGQFSLIEATQDAAEMLLSTFPETTHVYLASGSCLPLRPITDLTAFLANDPSCDYIESVDAHEVGWVIGGLNKERFTLYFPFDWRRRRKLFDRFVDLQRRFRINRRLPRGVYPYLGSQWWCLTASTLRAILSDPRRPEFDRYFKQTWIPDEGYFQSLVRRYSTNISSISLTLGKFDFRGRPYTAYDDHIFALLESNCFVARKVWPGATRLLSSFPRPGGPEPDISGPRPARIERLISKAVHRRILGRPGLYMQSRFPRKDAENGKTSAPYALFQGLTDIYPDFEPWLRDHLTTDVHGHLFGPEKVEFAGRPEVGPGAISSNSAVRDYDPQGFLTSLIRITDRKQVFQYSPRDNQKLNWFMATDPNAFIFVVTGAWNLPLIQMDLPFDNVRHITAMLQRTENDQLEVLNSIWVKARVQVWNLRDFAVRPRTILNRALREIDPDARPVNDLPEMRDLSGMTEHLFKLRDSGLHPQLSDVQKIGRAQIRAERSSG